MALLNTLTDNFNDNSINGTKWGTSVLGSGTVQETGQRLVLSSSNTTGTRTSALFSQVNYDFRGSTLVAEVPTLTLGGSASAYMIIQLTGGDTVMEVRVQSGDITLRISPTSDLVYTATYNSTTHRWWRLREAGGERYFDVSPDGDAWTNLYSYSDGQDISSVQARWVGAGSAGQAYTYAIDNVNLGFDISLVPADLSHGHSLESPTVDTQSAPLTGTSLTYGGFGSSFPGITYWAAGVNQFAIELEDVADLSHGHSLESVELTENVTLAVDDLLHAHNLESLDLIYVNTLAPSDLSHNHSLEGLTLFQRHELAVDDLLHAHLLESLILTEHKTLSISDLHHNHSLEGLTLFQRHELAVDDLLHAHLLESMSLTQKHVLAVADAFHGHFLDAVIVVADTRLFLQDLYHSHILEGGFTIGIYEKPEGPPIYIERIIPRGGVLDREDAFDIRKLVPRAGVLPKVPRANVSNTDINVGSEIEMFDGFVQGDDPPL